MKPIKVRIVVEVTIAKGATMLDVCELAEGLPATLTQNAEIKRAELVAIERVQP
jgi:hypothetical protein